MTTSREYESTLAEAIKAVVPSVQVTLGETGEPVDKSSTINVYMTDATSFSAGIADIFEASLVVTMRTHRADISARDLDENRRAIHGVCTKADLHNDLGALYSIMENFSKSIEDDYWQIVWSIKLICEISEG